MKNFFLILLCICTPLYSYAGPSGTSSGKGFVFTWPDAKQKIEVDGHFNGNPLDLKIVALRPYDIHNQDSQKEWLELEGDSPSHVNEFPLFLRQEIQAYAGSAVSTFERGDTFGLLIEVIYSNDSRGFQLLEIDRELKSLSAF